MDMLYTEKQRTHANLALCRTFICLASDSVNGNGTDDISGTETFYNRTKFNLPNTTSTFVITNSPNAIHTVIAIQSSLSQWIPFKWITCLNVYH